MPKVAAAFTVTVADRVGVALEDAAVYLEPVDAKAPGLKARAVEIDARGSLDLIGRTLAWALEERHEQAEEEAEEGDKRSAA